MRYKELYFRTNVFPLRSLNVSNKVLFKHTFPRTTMVKQHINQVTLTNNTKSIWTFNHEWFDSGRRADDVEWPQQIFPGQSPTIETYERDSGFTGCSGWVSYKVNGVDLFFAFSNPLETVVFAKNKIGLGLDDTIWDDMDDQYFGKSDTFPLPSGDYLIYDISSTSGITNYANFAITDWNDQIELANIEVTSAVKLFENLNTSGQRQYFRCDDSPTDLEGIALSHFKGISVWGDRVIFSHTNINGGDPAVGKYVISKLADSDWTTTATLDTEPDEYRHCCSSQACGSFMAMGTQEIVDGVSSKIQIFDNRAVRYFGQPKLIGEIEQPNSGVNGVAMAKEHGPGGKYIIAAINSHTISSYRSDSDDLFTNTGWTFLGDITNFEDSGSGLALVVQVDGTMWMFVMDAAHGALDNFVKLYNFDFSQSPPIWTKIPAIKNMSFSQSGVITDLEQLVIFTGPLPDLLKAVVIALLATVGVDNLNTSFRYGKGLSITSPTSINIFATDRNVFPLAKIPVIGTNQNFSMVKLTSQI